MKFLTPRGGRKASIAMNTNRQSNPKKQAHPRATGKWTIRGFPHKGWVCTEVEDLGAALTTCGMCEVVAIRYVHTMVHPGQEPVLAGCVCAGWMEGDVAAAQRREGAAKSRAAFAMRGWRANSKGGYWRAVKGEGLKVATIPYGTEWKIAMRADRKERFGSKLYPTEQAARLGAFDAVQAGVRP